MHAEIVNDHRERYFETKSHREKREYTMGIVESICEEGRFLKRDKNSWKEASFETARQKVAHAMQYRQRCLLNTASELSEDIVEDDKSMSSTDKDDVPTSNGVHDNNNSTSSIEAGLQTRVSIADTSRQFDSHFLNPKRTSDRFKDDVQTSDGENVNYYATSSIESGLLDRVDVSSQVNSPFCKLGSTTTLTTSETYPAKVRIVSNEMGLHVPNATRCQQFRSTYDSTSNKHFCSREHDTLSDLVFMSSYSSQPLNETIRRNEAFLPKSTDEQSADVQFPPPVNALLRGTSDFSFGDFSLDGEFMSNIEGSDHQNF